jgi:hypothetical protein
VDSARRHGSQRMIDIDVSSGRVREISEPHADVNLNPPIGAWQSGHLALVICGSLSEAKRRALDYGIRLYSTLENEGVTYARASLCHERGTRRWFARARYIEDACKTKGSPLFPNELVPGTLVGWASRFYSLSGLALNIFIRLLISGCLVLLTWFALGLYSPIGMDLLVIGLWIYWHQMDRHREGPTRDQWATTLKHVVSL